MKRKERMLHVCRFTLHADTLMLTSYRRKLQSLHKEVRLLSMTFERVYEPRSVKVKRHSLHVVIWFFSEPPVRFCQWKTRTEESFQKLLSPSPSTGIFSLKMHYKEKKELCLKFSKRGTAQWNVLICKLYRRKDVNRVWEVWKFGNLPPQVLGLWGKKWSTQKNQMWKRHRKKKTPAYRVQTVAVFVLMQQ